MAKMQMKLVNLYAYRPERKPLLEKLQELGVLDLATASLDEVTSRCPEGFARPDTAGQVQSFERSATDAARAVEILREAVPEKKGLKGLFSGRREVSAADFHQAAATHRSNMNLCKRVLDLKKQQGENQAEQVRVRAAMAQWEPWMPLDVSLRLTGTRTSCVFIGSLPQEYTEESLRVALAAAAPDWLFDLQVLGAKGGQTYLFLLCPRDQQEMGEQALRELGFARPPVSGGIPREEHDALTRKLRELEAAVPAIREELEQLAARCPELELTADYYASRAEKYRAIGEIRQSRRALLITGYAAARDIPKLEAALEPFTAVMEVADADPELSPVRLQNNAFVRPAESVTEMYSLPQAGEVDPTPVLCFFYYLFFGMMLSDAGYGLLMVLGCTWVLRCCHPEPAMARNMRLFLYCGISTIFWGLMFGSFFGDAVSVISSTFFGHEVVLKPLLFDPVENAIPMLFLSLGLGFAQILAGIGTKFYMLWKAGDKTGALFDCGLWITALLGVALLAVGMLAVPALTTVGTVIAVASAVGLVLTQGRKKKGIMKAVSGLASLYDSTSYVSDLMSYARLMALGITTGVMSSVFNMLGAMFGRSVVGAIAMVIIFLVGHSINFGINALGAYVHTLRLQYVELFGKFYEGGGRVFRPYAIKSKFVRIKED